MNVKRSEFKTSCRLRTTVLICGLVAMWMLQGCTVGPEFYKNNFEDFNDAIRKTSDGQMLANLVRMRYLESPVFLQVASISTSFNLNGSIGASAGLNDGGETNSYGIKADAGFAESPTITFSLPESRKYYGMLMAPLSSHQIMQLIDGGWNNADVLRTGLRGMNGLKNSSIEYTAYPAEPESYDNFHEAITLMEKLTKEGLAELKAAGAFTIWSTSIGPVGNDPLAQAVLAASTVYAKNAGADLVENADGKFDLHAFSRRLHLGFAPAAAGSADVQRLKSLLQLDTKRSSYPIRDFEFAAIEKGLAYVGAPPATLDPESIWGEIGVRGRSMMEIMQIASTSVQVPEEEISKGNVFVNPSAAVSQKLVIQHSKGEPSNAAIRVKHRGYWYFIADNDLESRASFALLNAFFAATAGTVPGATPVLTLPVGF